MATASAVVAEARPFARLPWEPGGETFERARRLRRLRTLEATRDALAEHVQRIQQLLDEVRRPSEPDSPEVDRLIEEILREGKERSTPEPNSGGTLRGSPRRMLLVPPAERMTETGGTGLRPTRRRW
ncbi:MAG TPA: hypothetical protein VMT85_25580 [Thermoanaerobaculia bacterium]|nr:hypothetical protein [Thermoanaerobaculia bacterium]